MNGISPCVGCTRQTNHILPSAPFKVGTPPAVGKCDKICVVGSNVHPRFVSSGQSPSIINIAVARADLCNERSHTCNDLLAGRQPKVHLRECKRDSRVRLRHEHQRAVAECLYSTPLTH